MISIWIWPLWTRRSYTIWLLLRPEVLSTHLKTKPSPIQRSSHGLTLPLKTLYQHRTEIVLVQRQRTLCKSINSLDLHLSLTGASPMKIMLNGFIPDGPELLRKSLTFNQNICYQELSVIWIICFYRMFCLLWIAAVVFVPPLDLSCWVKDTRTLPPVQTRWEEIKQLILWKKKNPNKKKTKKKPNHHNPPLGSSPPQLKLKMQGGKSLKVQDLRCFTLFSRDNVLAWLCCATIKSLVALISSGPKVLIFNKPHIWREILETIL